MWGKAFSSKYCSLILPMQMRVETELRTSGAKYYHR